MYRSIAFVLLAAACFREVTSSTSRTSVQQIRLGVFVPVTLPTGGDAVNLVGCQYAATFWFAIKELNEELSAKNITILGTVRDGVGMSKNTFTNGVQWATDYAQTAYNSTGVHGVVGGLLNYPTLALGYVLKEANIAQISYGADAPDLSHNDVFPDFLRTYPSASYQGYAIADIVANYFHWERVVVAYSTDIYGTDALAEFIAGAHEFGIHIVYSIAITPGQDTEDYDTAIDATMKYAPRIFVLLTSSAPLAASLLQQGYLAGLMNENSFTIGTSALSTSAIWTSFPDASLAGKVMSTIGYFGLLPADTDWMVTTTGKAFIARYRAQNATVTVLPSGTKVCNGTLGTALDDENRFYKYKIKTKTKYTCTGFVFSSFKSDGSNLAGINAHVYDSTRAMVYGILNATAQADGSYKIPTYLNGLKVKNALIQNVSFEGITGPISFSSGGRISAKTFGIGDRIQGLRFQVVNFQSLNFSASTFRMRRVGTWTKETGLQFCTDDSTLQYSVTGGCYDVNYATPGNAVPLDRAPPLDREAPEAFKQVIIALSVILAFIVFAVAVMLIWYRKTRLLKASQYPMMWLVWSSGVFGLGRVILATLKPEDGLGAKCVADVWMGHLSFFGIIALLIKTIRVHMLVNATGIKRLKISTAQVLYASFAIYSVIVVYLFVVSVVSTPTVKKYTTMAITGQVTYDHYCANDNKTLDYFLYAVEGLILTLAAKFCYDTKDVPDAINESRVIAIAIAIVIVISAITFPVVLVLGLVPNIEEFITGIAFFMGSASVMLIYFGPKFYLLASGADLDNKFNIIKKKNSKLASASKQKGLKMQMQQIEDTADDTADMAAKREALRAKLQPKSPAECEEIMLLMRGILLDLQLHALRDSSNNSNSASASAAASRPHSVDENFNPTTACAVETPADRYTVPRSQRMSSRSRPTSERSEVVSHRDAGNNLRTSIIHIKPSASSMAGNASISSRVFVSIGDSPVDVRNELETQMTASSKWGQPSAKGFSCKSSLVEGMLNEDGDPQRQSGNVKDGTTVCDEAHADFGNISDPSHDI